MKRIVVGVFRDLDLARAVVHDMAALNVPPDEISLISRVTDEHPLDPEMQETATVKDAKTGAVVGGFSGLLLGLSPILVPGVGVALVGGWLFATLAGATLGSITGSFAGALIDMGMRAQVAHHYTEAVNRGETVVMVRTHPELEDEIIALMQRDGAVEVHERNVAQI